MRMNGMASVLVCAICFFWRVAWPQSRPSVPIILTIQTASHGYAIPGDFSGLGFETASELPNHYGVLGHFFDPSNTQAITVLQNIGVKDIRVGGGTVNGNLNGVHCSASIPTNADIDNLFQFAHAAGVKVIYSLRLLNSTACADPNLAAGDARAASYIWRKYRASLDSFAIGNEPDWHHLHSYPGNIVDPAVYETIPGIAGSAYPSYLADWRYFAKTIMRSVAAATFVDPYTGSYTTLTNTPNPTSGVSWTQQFTEDEKNAKNGVGAPLLVAAAQHHYVGGSPKGTTTQQAIDNMLSRNWVDDTQISTGPEGPETYTPYPWLYRHNLEPVLKDGVPYRMTEANDVLGGVQGASNAYAAALWALDYMHWWAAHGMAGVNFHNNPWIGTDTIVPSPNPCPTTGCGNYHTTPKGYGMKAFDLGGHGYVEPIAISNPNNVNVTAYAVGDARDLYVTVINKTHNSTNDSADAVVTIRPDGFPAASVALMVLTDGDPGNAGLMTAKIGDASIPNDGRWPGQWIALDAEKNGQVIVTVPATTAAVVRIHAAGQDAGPIQMNQNGALEIFGIDRHGRIWHNWQKGAAVPNSSLVDWNGWTVLGGGVRSSAAAAVARNLDNTLEMFVPSRTGTVYDNHQITPEGAWSGWADMGASSRGITNLQAANNADGSLSVFGVGADGDLWCASQSAPGVGWSDWTGLRGEQINPGFVVGQNLNGRAEVFGVGRDGDVWNNWQASSGGWSGWNRLPGEAMNPQLAIARNLTGEIFIFGIGITNEDVWYASQKTPGGAWNRWRDLGTDGLNGVKIQPGFVVGQNADGRFEIAGVGSDGKVWHTWVTKSGDWSGWDSLGGVGIHPQLTIDNTADGRMQLFGIGRNKDVWSIWQTNPGGIWSVWSDFGERGMKFYSSQL
ncbi:MAG TPA: hypothetical protein VND66_06550 [Acidobacteriaceae bacterium]|nr:hypothetical protein [Acidobacteriaceae bacterium]